MIKLPYIIVMCFSNYQSYVFLEFRFKTKSLLDDSANVVKPRLIFPQFQHRLWVSRYFPCHFIQFTGDGCRHGHPGNKVNMCHHMESKVKREKMREKHFMELEIDKKFLFHQCCGLKCFQLQFHLNFTFTFI